MIGDADNSYGNCMNVINLKRTVKGFINAGFPGIILQDQVCLSSTADQSPASKALFLALLLLY